jgi:hypothetical protein
LATPKRLPALDGVPLLLKGGSKKAEQPVLTGLETQVDALYQNRTTVENLETEFKAGKEPILGLVRAKMKELETEGQFNGSWKVAGSDGTPMLRVTATSRRSNISYDELPRLQKFIDAGMFEVKETVEITDLKLAALKRTLALVDKQNNVAEGTTYALVLNPEKVITPVEDYREKRAHLRPTMNAQDNAQLDLFIQSVESSPSFSFKNTGK